MFTEAEALLLPREVLRADAPAAEMPMFLPAPEPEPEPSGILPPKPFVSPCFCIAIPIPAPPIVLSPATTPSVVNCLPSPRRFLTSKLRHRARVLMPLLLPRESASPPANATLVLFSSPIAMLMTPPQGGVAILRRIGRSPSRSGSLPLRLRMTPETGSGTLTPSIGLLATLRGSLSGSSSRIFGIRSPSVGAVAVAPPPWDSWTSRYMLGTSALSSLFSGTITRLL
mmetsp:Transcript_6525/g.11999  ORF Transcript_6525/g.11999 Transcript_6525/m.11999 type:complete len:227 (+) Transcript_6525:165-845(+)